MKKNDLVTTVCNGFDGKVLVAQIESIDEGSYATVRFGNKSWDTVYVRLAACTPYDGDEPIGTEVSSVPARPISDCGKEY